MWSSATPMADRQVRVTADEAVEDPGPGRLLIYGFRADQLNDLGLPSETEGPKFVWADTKKRTAWPIEVELKLPDDQELRLLAVWDVDDSGRLGPGDLLGTPTSLREALDGGSVVQLAVVQSLPGGPEGSSAYSEQAGVEPDVPFPTTEPKGQGCSFGG